MNDWLDRSMQIKLIVYNPVSAVKTMKLGFLTVVSKGHRTSTVPYVAMAGNVVSRHWMIRGTRSVFPDATR